MAKKRKNKLKEVREHLKDDIKTFDKEKKEDIVLLNKLKRKKKKK